MTAGIGSEILGQHVDRIVIDDILRSDNKLSDNQIEDYIDMNLSPMLLNRDGQMILVGCVNENTNVITEKGIEKIGNLNVEKQKLKKYSKKIYGIGGFNIASDVFYNGIQKTKNIITTYGYELEATYNHPILTKEKDSFVWKRMDELKINDVAIIQYGQNIFGNNDYLPVPEMAENRKYKKHSANKITKDMAYLMGLYTAEGSNYKEDSITITNTETRDFLLGNNDMNICFVDKRKDNTHYVYNSRYFVKQLKMLGLSFEKSYNKTLPNILGWKKELIVEFLKGYGDGDGCATKDYIKYTSTSKQLLSSIQTLLLNFGIVSSLTEFAYTKDYNSGFNHNRKRYDLTIQKSFVEKFASTIGFRIDRKQSIAEHLKNSNLPIIGMYPLLYKKLMLVDKKTSIKYNNRLYANKDNWNKEIYSKSLFSYLKDFSSKGVDVSDILVLLNSNLFVKIKKIIDSKSETYDFVISNTHSFISNGFVSHNTPKSDSDIFSEIKRRISTEPKTPWVLVEFPAILDYEKKILQCPDRFTWDKIMEKRLTMGPLKFAREYQLEFFSRDQSLFPTKIIAASKRRGVDMHLLDKDDKRGKEWSYIMGVDVARSGSVSADFTVAIVLAYNSVTQDKQIVHMWREKGLKISEQSRHIAELASKLNNCQVLVEQNNIGIDMIDTLADDYNVGVESFITGSKGQKKDELIRFLITAFEHEQIIMPQGDEWSRDQMSLMEGELTKFCVQLTPAGNEQFKGMGSHDDIVMSLALANKATQTLGVPFAVSSFGGGSGTTRDTNSMGSLISNDRDETDLVKLIRMGVIK